MDMLVLLVGTRRILGDTCNRSSGLQFQCMRASTVAQRPSHCFVIVSVLAALTSPKIFSFFPLVPPSESVPIVLFINMLLVARFTARSVGFGSSASPLLRSIVTVPRSGLRHQTRVVPSVCVEEDGGTSVHGLAAFFALVTVAAGTQSFTVNKTQAEPASEAPKSSEGGWFGFLNKKPILSHKLPPVKDVTSLPNENVTIWYKDGRFIFLCGALNNSKTSTELSASLVKQLKPDALFLDLNEQNFRQFKIAERVEQTLPGERIDWGKLVKLPEPSDELGPVPDCPHPKGFMASVKDPVEKSIRATFGQLRMAGVKSGDSDESWEFVVKSISEGLLANSKIIIGGRHHEITMQRADEAMQKSDRSRAYELAVSILPVWDDEMSAKENLKHVRKVFHDKVPVFCKVMFEELDAHVASKLDKDLQPYPTTVAIVMMIHASGIEKELEKKGWKHVETWSWATYH